jgi:hypothetical protein
VHGFTKKPVFNDIVGVHSKRPITFAAVSHHVHVSQCSPSPHPERRPSMNKKKKLNSVVLVRKRTIPTERPQPAGEVSANFS